MIVSRSFFDAENDGEVHFTLCRAVVEILHIQLLSKLSKCSHASDVPLVRANGHFGLALALSEERFGKF